MVISEIIRCFVYISLARAVFSAVFRFSTSAHCLHLGKLSSSQLTVGTRLVYTSRIGLKHLHDDNPIYILGTARQHPPSSSSKASVDDISINTSIASPMSQQTSTSPIMPPVSSTGALNKNPISFAAAAAANRGNPSSTSNTSPAAVTPAQGQPHLAQPSAAVVGGANGVVSPKVVYAPISSDVMSPLTTINSTNPTSVAPSMRPPTVTTSNTRVRGENIMFGSIVSAGVDTDGGSTLAKPVKSGGSSLPNGQPRHSINQPAPPTYHETHVVAVPNHTDNQCNQEPIVPPLLQATQSSAVSMSSPHQPLSNTGTTMESAPPQHPQLSMQQQQHRGSRPNMQQQHHGNHVHNQGHRAAGGGRPYPPQQQPLYPAMHSLRPAPAAHHNVPIQNALLNAQNSLQALLNTFPDSQVWTPDIWSTFNYWQSVVVQCSGQVPYYQPMYTTAPRQMTPQSIPTSIPSGMGGSNMGMPLYTPPTSTSPVSMPPQHLSATMAHTAIQPPRAKKVSIKTESGVEIDLKAQVAQGLQTKASGSQKRVESPEAQTTGLAAVASTLPSSSARRLSVTGSKAIPIVDPLEKERALKTTIPPQTQSTITTASPAIPSSSHVANGEAVPSSPFKEEVPRSLSPPRPQSPVRPQSPSRR
ncbi:hypothetical protein SeMB42_g07318, partial [Synchytrium endobioticum]